MRLSQKVALISGAARGIGASIARLFAQEGARVYLGDVELTVAQKVAQEIQRKGGWAQALLLEVAQAALFLASEEAAYITGEVLDVNGGLLMD